jgi:hypothetical protein
MAFSEFHLPLISSYIQFCFVSVGPRRFDFATLPNNLLNIMSLLVLSSILFTRHEHVLRLVSFYINLLVRLYQRSYQLNNLCLHPANYHHQRRLQDDLYSSVSVPPF